MKNAVALERANLPAQAVETQVIASDGTLSISPLQALNFGLLMQMANEVKALRNRHEMSRAIEPMRRPDTVLQRFQKAVEFSID